MTNIGIDKMSDKEMIQVAIDKLNPHKIDYSNSRYNNSIALSCIAIARMLEVQNQLLYEIRELLYGQTTRGKGNKDIPGEAEQESVDGS